MITGNEPISMGQYEDIVYDNYAVYNKGLPNEFKGRKILSRNMVIAPGLTIRQEFAARAMQGLASSLDDRELTEGLAQAIVREAVLLADALIAELNKPPTANTNL